MLFSNYSKVFILKALYVSILVCLLPIVIFSQETYHTFGNKGRMFIYWGWNRAHYSLSDISFRGKDYDFTLQDVIADDKPSPFEVDVYLNPSNMTIPQYNFRIGYFIKDKYSISFGADHMKYVVRHAQSVRINGRIDIPTSNYFGNYQGENITLAKDFLQLEHTDGLNYINTEIRRHDDIFKFGFITLQLNTGIGAGILVPRTDATLLMFERHDKFHLAGYGMGAMVGLQVKFANHFFIQSELKGGYINMPDIRPTSSADDVAKQSFRFFQYNILFGSYFGFRKQ